MKKLYIKPIASVKNMEIESMLTTISDPQVKTAAWDLNNEDVGVAGIGLNNKPGDGDVVFSRDRATVDWDF